MSKSCYSKNNNVLHMMVPVGASFKLLGSEVLETTHFSVPALQEGTFLFSFWNKWETAENWSANYLYKQLLKTCKDEAWVIHLGRLFQRLETQKSKDVPARL